MPTNRTVDTRAMLAAGESGAAAVQRAAELQSREADSSRQQTMQLASEVGRGIQAQQQIDEQGRSNRAREGLEAAGIAETVRRNRMGEAIAQDAQDIELADKELQSQGTSRADKLRSEMDRGAAQQGAGGAGGAQQQDPEEQAAAARYQDQAGRPLEVANPERRTVAPTEARQQQTASKLVTNRMNAQANYLNAVRNFGEAKLKGNEDAVKAELKSLQQPIKEAARMFDLGKKGELQPNQWEDIKALAGEAPDPALQQEIQTKQWGPALSRFMQARVSQSAIQFMAVTGDMPDGDLVDLASPAMRQFTQSAEQMQAYLRQADAGGLLSASLGIQSLADRNKMVRKLTAQAMLNDRATPKPSGGSIIPSQGGQRAIPAPGQQPGRAPNLEPGLAPPGINAGSDPNQRPGSPVQRALEQREQRTIDEQQRKDSKSRGFSGPSSSEERRRGHGRY